jgi:cytochrome c oxidase cbb3-type subunit II
MNRILEKLDIVTENPKNLVLTSGAAVLVLFGLLITLPFCRNTSNGAHENLTLDDSLVLAGQEVYRQEGCQYCHTKNLRSTKNDVARYGSPEKYGYFPLAEEMDYYYQSPALMGSFRFGPDLSRVGVRLDAAKLKEILTDKSGSDLRSSIHNYSSLFIAGSDTRELMLSWRIKALINAGLPYSDNLQRSVFYQMSEKSRGDALVAYLASLGKKKADIAGKFYQN